MIKRKVNLGEINLKLISGQEFANFGQTFGRHKLKHNTTEGPFERITIMS